VLSALFNYVLLLGKHRTMEGTAFFPSYVEGMSKLVQCIHSELPVFSRDCGEGGEKSFFSCGYLHFVDTVYRKPYNRHLYEVLQWEKPTKLYFDFDKYVDEQTDKEAFESLVQRFVSHVSKDIMERFSYDVAPGVTLMDASTDKKLSKHVVFQFYLTDIPTVKAYYDYLVGSFSFSDPDEAAIIDDGVYTRNRSFRLVYSSKFGKSNPLLINGKTEYCPTDVVTSMIQIRAEPHYRGPYRPLVVGQIHHFTGAGGARKRPRAGDSATSQYVPPSDLPEGVVDYIKTRGGTLRSGQREDNFLSFIVGGMHCPWVGRVHKSNNTFFTINTTSGMSWLRCSDTDCPNMHYCRVSLKWAFNNC
jgi:hypothetical protein